jgi:proton-dependent oligopeptide transporter, POT family
MKKIMNHFTSKWCHQPQGFYILLYTEIAGLYGQFSITALLILYMTSAFKKGDNEAFICYGAFTAFIYAIPLMGGYLADRIAGFKSMLLLGMMLMITGSIFLIFPSIHSLYSGLAIFSTGCGFFTPAITAFFGRLYAESDTQRDNAFTLYYIAKNVGALLAIIIGGLVATRYGYNYVYFISTAIMLSGYIVFLLGNKKLQPYFASNNQSIMPCKKSIFILITVTAVLLLMTNVMMIHHFTDIFMMMAVSVTFVIIARLYYKFDNDDRRKVTIILFTIMMMIIFSMFLGQGGTTLNLFIERIVNRTIGTYTIPPSLFYALDPFFMMILGTLVMSSLEKITGNSQITISFKKIAVGLFILGIGFLIFVAAATVMATKGIKPSVHYVVSAYVLFPIAELCMIPIIISLITRMAPRGYEGFMIGVYMLGNAIANYLTGVFSKMGTISFSTESSTGMMMAANIYQTTFIISALTLFFAAITSLIIIALYQREHSKRSIPIMKAEAFD